MKQKNPEQLLLPLPYRKAYNRDNFFVSDSNKNAVDMLDKYPNWETPALIIIGEKESGKTHLSHVLKEKDNNIRIFENIDERMDEEELFHALNRTDEKILITSHIAPNLIKTATPDLKSRLNAQISVKIDSPDDNLVGAIAVKQFYDNCIPANPQVLNYIINHTERSFSALSKLIKEIAKITLREKKIVSIKTVKEILTLKDFS